MNFFRGRKLKDYFCVSYLYSNELTGYVELLDLAKLGQNLCHILVHQTSFVIIIIIIIIIIITITITITITIIIILLSKFVRLLRKSKYFSVTSH